MHHRRSRQRKNHVNRDRYRSRTSRAVDAAALASAVPPELASILTEVIGIVAAGGAVTLGSILDGLTTTNAAGMLDISRPTLMKHIQSRETPAH
ncbi:hypothetical protein [Rhodococcus sp. KBS0724]|uniref:hypothetical protein n=1 Tax=Rhodococcus sp. KBS0724 TaxID=1179674 RepID=UPI0021B1478F|nr:hypothetical protein [Rhodococcus sp. KBS0724]